MLRVNRKVEYALMALKHMADKSCPLLEKTESEQLSTAREIGDKYQAPFDTVSKAMQAMASAGLLKSVKGVRGGYVLVGDLENVSYMDFVELIEGKSYAQVCQGEGKSCDLIHTCNISSPIEKLNSKLNQYLRSLSLKDLFEGALEKEAIHE